MPSQKMWQSGCRLTIQTCNITRSALHTAFAANKGIHSLTWDVTQQAQQNVYAHLHPTARYHRYPYWGQQDRHDKRTDVAHLCNTELRCSDLTNLTMLE
jgi:hypothetical protein